MMNLRHAFIGAVENIPGNSFVICTAPSQEKRIEIAGDVRCRWVLLNPGKRVCMERAFDRPNHGELVDVIKRFYAQLDVTGMDETEKSF